MNVYRQRMLNVAKALRESPNPDEFTMSWYGSSCGTPQCALGHYAFRTDLQSAFKLENTLVFPVADDYHYCSADSVTVREHFSLTNVEACTLFCSRGCNDAQTPEAAALYIERFVERKWPQSDEAFPQSPLSLGE